jgi:putative ABC transport system permease protein
MAREMRQHIELETADRVRQGMSPDQAHASALRDFGAIERFKEDGRDSRGTRAVEDLLRDIRHAARMLRRKSAYTATAVLTFALGIGAATAIFSVVYGVLLRPLPYRAPAQLVAVWEHNIARGEARNVVSMPNFEIWRERARSFTGMAAIVPAPVTLPGVDGPERVSGAEVTPGYFEMLGVRPALGRDFTMADAAAGGAVVILSDGYWRTRLGGDAGVLNRTLRVAGEPYTIVGVMPAGFEPPAFGWLGAQSLWMPLVATPQKHAWGRFLLVVGRLRPDVTLEGARDEMIAIARQLEMEGPSNKGWSAVVVPLSEQIAGHVRTSFLYILAAVVMVLALAVTNVGTLTLTETRRKVHELGVRRAIGASDRRIFRQIVTECLLLGLLGCAAGVAAAFPAMHFLVSLLPPDIPRQTSIRIDGTVLAVTAAVAFIAALGFGVLAASCARSAPSTLLREGSEQRGSARSSGRTLVVAEVALGLVVTVLAGLTTRSLIGLRRVDLGFNPTHVVVGRVAIGARYGTPDARRAFFDELLDRLRAQGFADVGIVSARPLGGVGPATTVRPGAGDGSFATEATADARWADAGFFTTLQVHVLEGKVFDSTDGPSGPVRAVINQSMARALWPGERPVGRRVEVTLQGGLTATVAGVIQDLCLLDPRTPPRPAFYLSARRFDGEIFDVVARSDRPSAASVTAIRQTLSRLDPTVPLSRVETMEALAASTLATDRFTALLLSSFAGLGLALAGVGIYGVFAGEVSERKRDMAIRMALGAARPAMLAMVLSRALSTAALGIVAGVAIAVFAAQSMRSILFGIATTDLVSFVLPAVVLLVVALVATLIPAIQASRISPLAILRGE